MKFGGLKSGCLLLLVYLMAQLWGYLSLWAQWWVFPLVLVQSRYPALSLYLDLAELRGYHYHTGVVFAAYTRTLGESLARGGRYDDVGAVYGSARPATGFATDLRVLLRFYGDEMSATSAIAAPLSDDAVLAVIVTKLREEGECVICTLDAAADERCDRELVLIDGDEDEIKNCLRGGWRKLDFQVSSETQKKESR